MVLIPGDIAIIEWGMHRIPEAVCIHSVHVYEAGDMSIRYRFASNPRGVDWSGFVAHDDTTVRVIARGIAHVDEHTRSMLS